MKKQILILFLLLLFPLQVFGIELNSPNYIIFDRTDGIVLEENNSEAQTAIASLTKIMSALVIIDETDNLDEEVTISWDMLNQVPTDAYKINLQAGKTYTVKDLLYATILPSAADAVTVLAVHNSGSVEAFVAKMNHKVEELELQNTHFTNPIGMDHSENKATLQDTLMILNRALDYEEFRTIYETKEYTMSDGKVISSSINRYSSALGVDTSRIKGAKTGSTGEAGYCLSEIFDTNNHEIISITTGAEQNKDSLHIRDGLAIIEYMDQNYSEKVLLEKHAYKKKIKVVKSKIKEIEVSNEKEIKKYLRNDYDSNLFRVEVNLPEVIDYKTEKEIGAYEYFYDDNLLDVETITLKEKIEPTLWEQIITSIWTYIGLGTVTIVVVGIIVTKKKKKRKRK